jgi:NhaA family Na+:H+ antiporter
MRGWAIPTATDIAFSLGVLALLGSRVPAQLKIFLMAVAVIDDILAIIIIAIFYTETLNFFALLQAVACVWLLWFAARRNIRGTAWYLAIGAVLWWSMLHSGVHATIAGVILGLMMPNHTGERVIHRLHPWVAFGIMPIFAFANAGVPLAGIELAQLQHPVTLGIALGLFLGKQIGIFGISWLAVRTRIAELPKNTSWKEFYAVGILAGIGFTMSLFIGLLAFPSTELQVFVRLGVIIGSLLSASIGYMCLAYVFHSAKK